MKRFIICFHAVLRVCMKVGLHFLPHLALLTHHLKELQQRDRLLDSQVYLDVLNLREIRTVIQHNPRPRTSAVLLLAALLRVSIYVVLYVLTQF